MDFWKGQFRQALKQNKYRKTWKTIATFMAAVVVFVTTYSLILPAITMDVETVAEEPGIDLGYAESEEQGDTLIEETSAEEIPQEVYAETSADSDIPTEDYTPAQEAGFFETADIAFDGNLENPETDPEGGDGIRF